MHTLSIIGLFALAYFIGSIPFGLLVVKLRTGEDIRHIQSGRTGGTNAMRAAGFWAGLSTALLDILKAATAVWLAKYFFPSTPWIHALAPIFTIIGHNYSVFLMEKSEKGFLRLRGGAGGASCVGGAVGLWWPTILIILPAGALILFGIGYASVATMSVAVLSIIIFSIRAWLGLSSWWYVLYGILSEIILVVALLPNIRRLRVGTERLVGWRAKRAKNTQTEGQAKA